MEDFLFLAGAKPVYELKNKKYEAKPKLEIKDTSRNEKYDLVFEGHDSDGPSDEGEKSHSSKKHSKRKKDSKV